MQAVLETGNKKKKSTAPEPRYIEIMDTTLRDGEQTSGVSFSCIGEINDSQIIAY
jgi:hypothetical protein